MSKDQQVRTWDYFGDNSKNFSDRLNQPVIPSFDFAQGPVTKDQLLEWVDHPDYACPDVVQFDYQRVTKLISDCLANREKVSHLRLPPVFWRLLEENLAKAEKLWDDTLHGQMAWSPNALEQDEHESVFTTATQLHLIFSRWYSKHGRGLNGTGDAVWKQVLVDVDFCEAKYDRVRLSVKGVECSFFLWEADYRFIGRPEFTRTIQSPEIAAWFVLFSLHKVYRLFCLLMADVLRGPDDGDDAELSHYIFEYWVDIQSAMAVATYWYDRIYSLNETLSEFEKRVSSRAEAMTREELEKLDAPIRSVGLVRLFNWFKYPSSAQAGSRQWEAFWMAKEGQLQPHKNFEWDVEALRIAMAEFWGTRETTIMKLTFDKALKTFREENPLQKNWLEILDRRHTTATKENLAMVVVKLIGNSDNSAKTIIERAFKAVEAYEKKLGMAKKEYFSNLTRNKAKVKKDLMAGKITKH